MVPKRLSDCTFISNWWLFNPSLSLTFSGASIVLSNSLLNTAFSFLKVRRYCDDWCIPFHQYATPVHSMHILITLPPPHDRDCLCPILHQGWVFSASWPVRVGDPAPEFVSKKFLKLNNMNLPAQTCLTLCDPMDSSPPGSPVYGISQAKILEWVAISSSTGSSRPRDWTRISCIYRQILYHWAIWEAPSRMLPLGFFFWRIKCIPFLLWVV